MQKLIEIIQSFGFVKASKEGETPYVYKHLFKDQHLTIYGAGGRMDFLGEKHFLGFRTKRLFSVEETSSADFKQIFSTFLLTHK